MKMQRDQDTQGNTQEEQSRGLTPADIKTNKNVTVNDSVALVQG